jgi:hypothetical protein
MSHSRPVQRLATAIAIGLATSVLAATSAFAAGGCTVTVQPHSVPVGGQFTVSGNFGGASIFIVKGVNASPAQNAQPNATTPAGSSFSVTFTAEASDIGQSTVWGLLPASECGDSDQLTVTASPNTATSEPAAMVSIGFMLLVLAVALAIAGLATRELFHRRGAESVR